MKKLARILLALCAVFLLFGSGDRAAAGGIISAVEVNGYREPVKGERPQTAGEFSVPEEAHYSVTAVDWYKTPVGGGTAVQDVSSPFSEAYSYSLYITLKPEAGYQFDINAYTVLLDGSAVLPGSSGESEAWICYVLPGELCIAAESSCYLTAKAPAFELSAYTAGQNYRLYYNFAELDYNSSKEARLYYELQYSRDGGSWVSAVTETWDPAESRNYYPSGGFLLPDRDTAVYRVRARYVFKNENLSGDPTVGCGLWSEAESILVIPGTQLGSVLTENGIRLSWQEIPGAEGYRIYRDTYDYVQDGPFAVTGKNIVEDTNRIGRSVWTLVADTRDLSCFYETEGFVQTFFKVRAYISDGQGGIIEANEDSSAEGRWMPPVTGFCAMNGKSGITLSWNAAAQSPYTAQNYGSAQDPSVYYRVWRSEDGGTTWSEAPMNGTDGSAKTSFLDTSVTDGREYVYKLEAVQTLAVPTCLTDSLGNIICVEYKYYAPAVTLTTVFDQSGTTWPVKNFRAEALSSSSIKLRWDKNTEADGFIIYRSESEDGSYKKVLTVSGSTKTYVSDTGLEPGKEYFYKIRAYKTVDGSKKYGSYSKPTSQVTKIEAPRGLKTEVLSKSSVKLSWTASEGPINYEIYRYTDKAMTKGEFIGSCAYTYSSFTDKSCTPGKTYYYKLTAVSLRNLYTASSTVSVTVKPAKVSGLKVLSLSGSALKLSWSKVSGAAGYQIYRGTSKDAVTTLVKTVSSGSTLSYTDTGRTTGRTYYYRVRAYFSYNGNKITGSYSSTVSGAAKTLRVLNTAAKTYSASAIRVSWDKSPGVTGYKVYRASTKTGSYKLIKTVKSPDTLSFTDTGRTYGKTYYYKVRAYAEKDGTTSYSAYSSAVSAKAELVKVSGVKAEAASSTSVKLSWSKVLGADGYKIYRSTSKSGTYTLIKTVKSPDTLSYKNTGRTQGKTYYYRIRAYRALDSKTVYGAYSSTVSCTP